MSKAPHTQGYLTDLLAVDCQFNSNEHLHYYNEQDDCYDCPFNFPPVVLKSDWMAMRLFQLKKTVFKVLSALDEGQPSISILIIVGLAMLLRVLKLL